MKKVLVVTCVVCALIGVGIGNLALGNSAVKGDEPAMMVSPSTIVLAKVGAVTVHTNIPEGTVAPGTVTLDGVAPILTWADDCGHLAARFAVADLALQPGRVTLTLCGTYVGDDADTFAAEDVVRVK